MLSYKALEIVGEEGRGDDIDRLLDITHKQIENMQKIIRVTGRPLTLTEDSSPAH
jgi:hypothetical protein